MSFYQQNRTSFLPHLRLSTAVNVIPIAKFDGRVRSIRFSNVFFICSSYHFPVYSSSGLMRKRFFTQHTVSWAQALLACSFSPPSPISPPYNTCLFLSYILVKISVKLVTGPNPITVNVCIKLTYIFTFSKYVKTINI